MKEGQRVEITRKNNKYVGYFMPSHGEMVVIKMDNGYNVGFRKFEIEIKELPERVELEKFPKIEIGRDEGKSDLLILSTGGTIASRVDYRTGAVIPASSAEEILFLVPELGKEFNIEADVVFKIFSEDMRFENYAKLSERISEKIIERREKDSLKKLEGVLVFHGTDTMHYTSAALSFIFNEFGIPILLVGAQRSSDRGSCDGPMNILCASGFLKGADFGEVGICMHDSANDDFCAIHKGTKARKMNTSRRDAFKTINASPYARVGENGKRIEILDGWNKKKWENIGALERGKLKNRFEEKVALIKIHPNMDSGIMDYFDEKKYKGIVLEGTGLGHAPINADRELAGKIKKMNEKGVILAMTSQCINGRVNMNVYSTGRDLAEMGVIPCEDMLSEVALVKLKWLLGNFKEEEARKMINKNIAGEISERRTE